MSACHSKPCSVHASCRFKSFHHFQRHTRTDVPDEPALKVSLQQLGEVRKHFGRHSEKQSHRPTLPRCASYCGSRRPRKTPRSSRSHHPPSHARRSQPTADSLSSSRTCSFVASSTKREAPYHEEDAHTPTHPSLRERTPLTCPKRTAPQHCRRKSARWRPRC